MQINKRDLEEALSHFGLEIMVGDFVKRDGSSTTVAISVTDFQLLLESAALMYQRSKKLF